MHELSQYLHLQKIKWRHDFTKNIFMLVLLEFDLVRVNVEEQRFKDVMFRVLNLNRSPAKFGQIIN